MRTEAAILVDHPGGARGHVLGILDGLSDADWRRSVVPSGWSPIQVVSHLALDDERFWFGAVLAGDPKVVEQLLHDPWDAWRVSPEVTPGEIVSRYRAEAARSDARLVAADLDAPVAFWPEFMGPCWMGPSARSCCTCSPRPRRTPVSSMSCGSWSRDGSGWS